jgi:hypothetical protein
VGAFVLLQPVHPTCRGLPALLFLLLQARSAVSLTCAKRVSTAGLA